MISFYRFHPLFQFLFFLGRYYWIPSFSTALIDLIYFNVVCNMYILEPLNGICFPHYHFLFSIKAGWSNHNTSNWNGLVLGVLNITIINITSQWFDPPQGRRFSSASIHRISKSTEIKNLSSLNTTWCCPPPSWSTMVNHGQPWSNVTLWQRFSQYENQPWSNVELWHRLSQIWKTIMVIHGPTSHGDKDCFNIKINYHQPYLF